MDTGDLSILAWVMVIPVLAFSRLPNNKPAAGTYLKRIMQSVENTIEQMLFGIHAAEDENIEIEKHRKQEDIELPFSLGHDQDKD